MFALTAILVFFGLYCLVVGIGKFCFFIHRQGCKTDGERVRCIDISRKYVQTINTVVVIIVHLCLISFLIWFIIYMF